MTSDYRLDGYGRQIHKDFDALAVEITKGAASNGGHFPKKFEVEKARFQTLLRENAKFNGGSPVYADIGQMNFIWCGIPVVPGEA